MIKQLIYGKTYPIIPEDEKIKFKFKKKGQNKLLLFDLDETLIHKSRREDYDDEEDREFQSEYEPDVELTILNPGHQTYHQARFSLRPFVK